MKNSLKTIPVILALVGMLLVSGNAMGQSRFLGKSKSFSGTAKSLSSKITGSRGSSSTKKSSYSPVKPVTSIGKRISTLSPAKTQQKRISSFGKSLTQSKSNFGSKSQSRFQGSKSAFIGNPKGKIKFPTKTLPGKISPGKSLPKVTFPKTTFPKKVLPKNPLPGKIFPGKTIPKNPIPGIIKPGTIKPGKTIPGKILPGKIFPGKPGTKLPKLPPVLKPSPKPFPPIVKPLPKPFPVPPIIKPLPIPLPKPLPLPPIVKPVPPIVLPKPPVVIVPTPPICLPGKVWCGHRPVHCHWWWNVCPQIRYTELNSCVSYSCNIVTADVTIGETVVEDVRWYLGLTGMELPKTGLGVETVEEDSPAANAGLLPGMVIVECNEIEIVDGASFAAAIDQSGGVLNLKVLSEVDGEAAEVTIEMKRLVSSKF